MPAITADAPRIEREFAEIKLQVPQLFAEGSVLSATEAAFINQQLGSVVGNQFGGLIRREKAKNPAYFLGDPQLTFDTMFANYKIGESNRGEGKSTNPTEVEALKIGVELVKKALKAKGLKFFSARTPTGITNEKVTELATAYVAANPSVTDLAQQRVSALSALSADLDASAPEPVED